MTNVPYREVLRVPMTLDSALLMDELLFEGEWSAAFFVVGDFTDRFFTLGQPDRLQRRQTGQNILDKRHL